TKEENERSAERTGPAFHQCIAFSGCGRNRKGRVRPSGSAAGLRADSVSAVSQADETRSGCAEVDRPRPVCAVEWACVDAAVWGAASLRLRSAAGAVGA